MAVSLAHDWHHRSSPSMDPHHNNQVQPPNVPRSASDPTSAIMSMTSPNQYPNHPFPPQVPLQWPPHQGAGVAGTPPGTPSVIPQPAFGYPGFAAPNFFPQQSPFPQHGFLEQQQQQQQQQQQFAQWAYQQMMFNAAQQQQQQQQMAAVAAASMVPRSRTPSGPQQRPDQTYAFQQQQQLQAAYPPLQQQQQQQPQQQQQQPTGQNAAFHPYRRPKGPPSNHPNQASDDWRNIVPQAPYAREKNNSSSSLNSSHGSSRSGDGSRRGPPSVRGGASIPTNGRTPTAPLVNLSSPSPSIASNSASLSRAAHQRGPSASSASTTSSTSTTRTSTPSIKPPSIKPPSVKSPISPTSPASPAASASPTSSVSSSARPIKKPSPLSQQPTMAASPDKRLSASKDDGDLTDAPTPTAAMMKAGGLKSRLRKALSISALDDPINKKPSSDKKSKQKSTDAQSPDEVQTETESIRPKPNKGKSRAAALFNRKFNASTDNISVQSRLSTVSSASVMLRKIGSLGGLMRRSSLVGISGMFKDKDKNKDGEGKKGKKSGTAEATVAHVTVEVDRGGDGDEPIKGLSPAAEIARRHTLRSNAEAEARLKARLAAEEQEREASGSATSKARRNGGDRSIDQDYEFVGGDGSDEEEEDEETGARTATFHVDAEDDSDEDDDDDEGTVGGDHEDEELTVTMGSLRLRDAEDNSVEDEEWAVGLRRSVERTKVPTKGILKNTSYDQEVYLVDGPNAPHRARSNSYNSHKAEPGPLARIPSPDPDHIDGLHKSSTPHESSLIPPLNFGDLDFPELSSPSPLSNGPTSTLTSDKSNSFQYSHPNLNSSAPALSTMLLGHPGTHRSATAPLQSKKLTFAANLSVYDTFSPTAYDRRSEPATCNRLTPALAQRIKEELNSYKMEEMEVHAASRIHTHFFV